MIDPFLFELFGLSDTNLEKLVPAVTTFYTIGQLAPKVTIRDNLLIVELADGHTASSNDEFERAIDLCNSGQFTKAKPLLTAYLKANPTHSEANRVLGQIYSDEGDQEKAQDFLIEALKWDPKNKSALVMMGNILSNYRKDIATSQKYFEQARKVSPNDHLILNNMGGNLLKLGKWQQAKDIFWDAIKLKDDYPNTHYALALIAKEESDLNSAFFSAIQAIKFSRKADPIYGQALQLAIDISRELVNNLGGGVYDSLAQQLRNEFRVKIDIVNDDSIGSPAILQLAELYNREQHVIRYKEAIPTHAHWIVHELTVLQYILQAKAEGKNLRFAVTSETQANFKNKLTSPLPEQAMQALYQGLNQQIFNTPAALFAEHDIFNEFAELRPHQFLSLLANVQEGIAASTDERILQSVPEFVLRVNRIYNILKAFQFQEFYGVDMISDFHARKDEISKAYDMFREFTEYRDEKNAGDEYKLLEGWASQLQINDLFILIAESESREGRRESGHQAAQMAQFQESAAEAGFNMAVTMYMVDALEYFSAKSHEHIKKTALEIAMLGMQGIQPDKQGYKIRAVPEKTFSGYHLLAYYYVTFALAFPGMLNQLGLPYDGEYAMALKMARK
ncbi:tetratricopeptide repeat protein [Turneriella parva]|uniref:tetratricopeptide repeat protein n=1 Tax=Turneriella parva TaxID=29510 RepID=UPI000300802D|nr:tetratricopeptide repeat protein [Turneriella parva]